MKSYRARNENRLIKIQQANYPIFEYRLCLNQLPGFFDAIFLLVFILLDKTLNTVCWCYFAVVYFEVARGICLSTWYAKITKESEIEQKQQFTRLLRAEDVPAFNAN